MRLRLPTSFHFVGILYWTLPNDCRLRFTSSASLSGAYPTIADFVSLRRHPLVELTQSLSTKRFAFSWLLSFSSVYESKLSTQLRTIKACHFRDRLCDPDWIRTNDPHLRRMTLYPAELPNQELPIGAAK